MTYFAFAGALLTACGPMVALFLLIIAWNAQLVLFALLGACFFLLAQILSSLVWTLVRPLQQSAAFSLAHSIALQEVVRWLACRLVLKVDTGLAASTNDKRPVHVRRFLLSVALGWGFGLSHFLVNYGSFITQVVGPGTLYTDSCPIFSFYYASALYSLVFSTLNITLTVIAMISYRTNNIIGVLFLNAVHVAASYLTLLNGLDDGCLITLPILLVVIAAAVVVANLFVRRDFKKELSAME